MKRPLVKRYEHSPILTKDDIPYSVEIVHNSCMVKHKGKYIMIYVLMILVSLFNQYFFAWIISFIIYDFSLIWLSSVL